MLQKLLNSVKEWGEDMGVEGGSVFHNGLIETD
jgi:hypothetical protein